jgi:hypothetical protein
MSHINPSTGRYADDFSAQLHAGTATVEDLLAHAQEIIVDAPEVWGRVVTEPVRLLLVAHKALAAGLDVQPSHNIGELDLEQA